MELLTRDNFRDKVFNRDDNICIVPDCGNTADDAHHIIERRLWIDDSEKEGYIINNGASLCEWHHRYGAETCAIQPQVLRKWVGINEVVLPKQFDTTKSYDKWGIKLKRPTRANTKYPSTPYLHLSPGYDENDINLPDLRPFLNQPLVITIKRDGSNAKITRDFVAARNGTSAEHSSFDWLKAEHSKFCSKIPENIIIFGEYSYAKHSIHYVDNLALPNYLEIFGVYDMNTFLFGGWNEVQYWSDKLEFPTVPVIAYIDPTPYHGPVINELELENILKSHFNKVTQQGHEGLVIRTMYPFPYANFEGYVTTNGKTSWHVNAIGKMVRPNHVQTDEHWSQQPIIRNKLKS